MQTLVQSSDFQTAPAPKRLEGLDSIRGIACLAVLLGHSAGIATWDTSYTRIFLLNNLFDGRSAVTIFFVLSGFVLSLRHVKQTSERVELIPFYARRICRIWVPWLGFFLISIIAKNYFFIIPELKSDQYALTVEFRQLWSADSSYIEYFKQIIFTLHDPRKLLIPQDWSLGVELRASLIIPFIILAARRSILFVIILATLATTLKPSSGCYYASFCMGVLAARIHSSVEKSSNIPSHAFLGLFLAGILIYQIRWFAMFSSLNLSEQTTWNISSLGCLLLILGAANSVPLKKLLSTKPLIFLGRISFSLYLAQVIVILTLSPWFISFLENSRIRTPSVTQALTILFVATVSVALAWVGEKIFEQPSIQLGRISSRLLGRIQFIGLLKV